MCNRDFQYFKKCLASRGEVQAFDKNSQETVTYANHNGKLVKISSNEKINGEDATYSFISSLVNPQVDMKVIKEGENSIDTGFLNYLKEAEQNFNNSSSNL